MGRRIAKHPFTLIELCLVMVLLGLAAGVIGVQTLRLVRTREFLASVDLLYEAVVLGQMEAMVHQTEVELWVAKEGDHHVLGLRSESALPACSSFRRRSLVGITEIKVGGKGVDSLLLTFTSSGSWYPLATLAVEGRSEVRNFDLTTPLLIRVSKADA